MALEAKEIAIVAQVAVKAAVDLAVAELAAGQAGTVNISTVKDNTVEIAETLYQIIEAHEAVEEVKRAFPGAQNVTGKPEAQPQAQQANLLPDNVTPLPRPGNAGITADSPIEDLWNDLFSGNGQWEDVRNRKNGNSRRPDFQHKSIKKGQYNLGLWISSSSTPEWVKEYFRNEGK